MTEQQLIAQYQQLKISNPEKIRIKNSDIMDSRQQGTGFNGQGIPPQNWALMDSRQHGYGFNGQGIPPQSILQRGDPTHSNSGHGVPIQIQGGSPSKLPGFYGGSGHHVPMQGGSPNKMLLSVKDNNIPLPSNAK